MNGDLLGLVLRLTIYFVSFFVFLYIIKYRMKRKLNYSNVAISGFIVGFLFSLILIIIGSIMSGSFGLSAYSFGGMTGEGIIEMIIFIMLYWIGKQVMRKYAKKNLNHQ